MANTHMQIQNVILYKRYVRDLLFSGKTLSVFHVGGRKSTFTLHRAPTEEEIKGYETELEDR